MILLFLLCGLIPRMSAQEVNIDPSDKDFIQKYASFDFKGDFAVKVFESDNKNYYILDFTVFPDRFRKVWFMNLTFGYSWLVNLDSDISHDRIWFFTDGRVSEKETLELLTKLKKQTDSSGMNLTEPEKKNWLKDNDKYK